MSICWTGPRDRLVVEIELPNRIHVVAKKLDANRIAHQRRKHIDDAAANRKLAGSADRFLPDVAGSRKMLDKQILGKIIASLTCRL